MAAGGPVDPTEPVPTPDPDPTIPVKRGAPTEQPTGGFGTDDSFAGAYDPTVAVPADADGGGPSDGDDGTPGEEGDDRRKWLWGALAALGVIILGVIIALLVSGGG